MGKPVVASALPMVERTFAPDTIRTYRPGDADDLAAAILATVDDPDERVARVARTAERVSELSWEREAIRYVGRIESLAVDGLSSPGPADRPIEHEGT
jgi:glycosyltransferase involved in cell wall biosynthesis